jgi:hypothetical protein
VNFHSVAEARQHLWLRLLTELQRLENLGVLFDEECDGDNDERRMALALVQVKKTIAAKVPRD